MDGLTDGLSKIAYRVADEFERRGGKLLNDGVVMPADLFATEKGALGPLLWLANEFTTSYEMAFPGLSFSQSDEALTGYQLSSINVPDALDEVTVLTFTDFLRNEVMPPAVEEVDLGPLLANFREWCLAQGPSAALSPAKGRPGTFSVNPE